MNHEQVINIKDLLPDDWKHMFSIGVLERTQQRLDNAIIQAKRESRNVFPDDANNVFKIFKLCPLHKVRVVVLGQDPYPKNASQANGIAFSVQSGVTIPPSLRNMFKEIQRVYPETKNTNGNLTNWVEQGVFLLNTALTVVQGQPGSHIDVWVEFTDEVLRIIERRERTHKLVYCLWGKFAEKKRGLITNPRSKILACSHPSPLSAYKTDKPFIGSGIFKCVNDETKESIKWNTE